MPSLSEEAPLVAARWHPTRNGTLTPTMVSAGSGQRVWWFCPKTCPGGCPHEWEASIVSQVKATGCPHCLPRSHRVCVHRSIVGTHPDVAAQWHPTRNGDVTPDTILAGSTKKYWWLCAESCPEGCPHEWEEFVANRCKGKYGCPFCPPYQRRVCIHTSIVGTHPAEAAQWHPTRNGELRPENFSFGSEKVVWWLCPKTTCAEGCPHEWATEISKRLKRGADAGCPFCASNHKSTCVHNSIVTTHPDLMKEWDWERNKGVEPGKCVPGCYKKVSWKCLIEKSHLWRTRICDRTYSKTGCPFCFNKTEGLLLEYLKREYPDTIHQFKLDNCKRIKCLPFDFCIPSLKLIIEIDGAQHFRQVSTWRAPEETQRRDIYKMKQAENQGYRIIRVFQEDISKEGEAWLDIEVMPEIKSDSRDHVFITTKADLYARHIELYSGGEVIELV